MARALCRFAFLLRAILSAGAVVLSRIGRGDPAAPETAAEVEAAPQELLQTWRASPQFRQLEKDLAAARPSNLRLPGTHRIDDAIMNFSAPGLCYAPPMEKTVEANWARIEGAVKRGRELAADMKVILTGLVRNAEFAVHPAYKSLMRIAQQFKDYRFLIYENDSTDRTEWNLRDIAMKDKRFSYLSERLHLGNTRGVEQDRMVRMATLRNKLRDGIAKFMSQSPDWDLIIMVDFDIFTFGRHVFSPHSFFATLGRTETANDMWDMVCANSLRHIPSGDPEHNVAMYDCFAFRKDERHDIFNGATCGFTMGRKMFSGYDLVPVRSCFGGMALYKPKGFFRCRYDPSVYDCEHVVLHRCMSEHGSKDRMFMDPLLNMNYDSQISQECSAGPAQ